MTNSHAGRFRFRLTLISIVVMLVVGGIIIFLDRHQMAQLAGKGEWQYIVVALVFVAVSYFLESSSTVAMLRVFGVQTDRYYLFRVGLVSSVLSRLIALPAALGLQLLVLEPKGVAAKHIVGSSILLSYFKNLMFYALIPLSLIFIIFTYPLILGGVISMVVITLALTAAIVISVVIVFKKCVRIFVLDILGHIWHLVTRQHIETSLNNFEVSLTLGIQKLREKPRLGLVLAGLITGDVACMIIALWFCFKALAIPVHPGALITAFNFGITLTIISFIPGDMGVQEASIAGILVIFGVPFSQSIIAAILFRVLYYFAPFVFSLAFYWGMLKSTREIIPPVIPD
jgi:uncharacterized protein (TIRG00374 family)